MTIQQRALSYRGRRIPLIAAVALLTAGLLSLPRPSFAADSLVVGTASASGVYHVAGRAICRLLDQPCEARTSAGSMANLKEIREGTLPVALAQSDLQYHAVRGLKGFAENGADDNLRALFSLHGEPFTLVARRDAGIQSFDDLKRHSVNIGNPGSGQRGTMMQLMAAKGWTLKDFTKVNELPANQHSMELCHGNIEAMVYTVGHPNASVRQAIRLCDAILVDVVGPDIDTMIQQAPYYTRARIPAALYRDDQPAVETFGVRATLVASTQTDSDLVYTLVATVFDNLDRFKKFHPAFSMLTPKRMIHEGLSAPLHEGALRYYREQGWIDDSIEPAESSGPTQQETSG